MFARYPHTAKISISKETDEDDGISQSVNEIIEIKGRFEPTGQSKTLDYKAKFYSPILDFIPFEVDGQTLIYQGKHFKIVQLHNYQTHCELWVD